MSADLLKLTLGELLERALAHAPAAEADPWIDVREQPLVAHRELLNAGKRGELELYRTGRKTLVRRSELDRWIARPEHRVGAEVQAEPAPASNVEHILQRAGYSRRSAGGSK